MVCVHGKPQTYERAWVQLTVEGDLAYLVLLGQDWPHLQELLGMLAQWNTEY